MRHSLPAVLAAQAKRSLFYVYLQLPWLPEHSRKWTVPLLWRQWSRRYDATEYLQHVERAMGKPEHWRAALCYYRTLARPGRTPNPYMALQRHWRETPRRPTLHLYGGVTAKYSRRFRAVLPPGCDVETVDNA